MTTTICHIGDRDYRLDYDSSRITSGRIYHGTVYMAHILDFYFEVPDDGTAPLFSPGDTPREVREAILHAVQQD